MPYHHGLARAGLWSLSEPFRNSSLLHGASLLFSAPTLDCFAFAPLFFKNLVALIGALLFGSGASALPLRVSSLLLDAGALLCLALLLLSRCPRPLLGISCLLLGLLPLLCGSRCLFLRLARLLCGALLSLAVLLGRPRGLVLRLPLLLRDSGRGSRLLLGLVLLLHSCPRSLLLRRVRCLPLLRGSPALLLCSPRRLLLRMLLCGTNGLLLLCSGPGAILCLSVVRWRLCKLQLLSTRDVREEKGPPQDERHHITARTIHGAVLS